jgi:hypothetical protein
MADQNDGRSIGELFSELANGTTALVRQELTLAKIELSQKAGEAGKRVGLAAAGGAVAYVGLAAVVAALILLLGQYIALWLSALIIGVAVMAIGYVLSQQQIQALKDMEMTPQATVETLKQDKEWAKEQIR